MKKEEIENLFDFDQDLLECSRQVRAEIALTVSDIQDRVRINTAKVLKAFCDVSLGEHHFTASTGYGYDDMGREKLEEIYAKTFGAESALVRIQMVSGTHALAVALFGCLRPDDLLVSVTGTPYDTMTGVIGHAVKSRGSLTEYKVRYDEIALGEDGKPNLCAIAEYLSGNKARMVMVQRSRGYAWRDSLSISDIEAVVQCVKSVSPDTIVFVDNCYGEFTDTLEPTAVGADIMAGSLIKNPGGGISPSGGYVAGRADLVEMAAERLTAPGLGSHCGPSLGFTRVICQGFYMAPMIVGEALSGSVFASRFLEHMGYEVLPRYDATDRNDIVLSVNMKDPDSLLSFVQSIQAMSPVDSYNTPEPAPMPGYEDQVVMAAGAFTQGSSIELSADAPMRPPYTVYLQGGINRYQVEFALLKFAQKLKASGKFKWN